MIDVDARLAELREMRDRVRNAPDMSATEKLVEINRLREKIACYERNREFCGTLNLISELALTPYDGNAA